MGKKKQTPQSKVTKLDDSSDEGPTPLKKRALRPVSSDSDEECSNPRREMRKRKSPVEEVLQSSKKRKITRCVDSSDEENVEISAATPKANRMNKLLEMRKKIQAKKKVTYDTSESSEAEGWLENDEDDLPMWENEEVPPEDVTDGSETEGIMDDFIVEDEDELEAVVKAKKKKVTVEDAESESYHDLSDAEEKLKKKKRKKQHKRKAVSADEQEEEAQSRVKTSRRAKKCKREADENEEGLENQGSESSEEETDYGNPYMQMDHALENANIIDLLSKNTDKDKKNAKKYKKEMGKYQYAVHSDRNKAAKVSNKARFAANMGTVKADRGFKSERNLDIKDSEYHDYKETCLFGERVRIFPHTKKYSKYKSRCALRGCGEPFSVGETRIIGVTKFSDINFQFMKKVNNFGKESFYYICERHCPKTDSDSEEYTSGDD